ncbi:TolC family protein [Mucilaginibacter agri]|uniref:TolC family protein n=1 Tax=Mucilaginibacter agri TaxID=2695265 RepID=A0A966DQW4_9SPHI|nr:TolC family protein [Mucilaginibacter agri]NCD68423.1 TolC family protein [Mucilaginibacter agri]
MKPLYYILFFILCITSVSNAATPDTLRLTLTQVIELARKNSIAAKQAIAVKETKYWQWRTYKSNYQPQLSLTGILPGYSKTYTQVQQPNGTVLFQPIHNDNSSLQLDFSQTITATGGTIYGTTNLQRFDDFDRNNVLYNGVPYAVGFSQPLFQYNSLKWDKRIEPLKYNESKQAFIESQEQIAVTVEGYFFDLLLAQVNQQVAEINLTNTQQILKVAKLKFELGKVSKNEILQLQLELLNAQKAVGVAKRNIQIATLTLRSYMGFDGETNIALIVPEEISRMEVNTEKVLAEAFANRSDAIAFMRRIAEAQRDVAKAKGQTGLTASLTANLGFSNSASNIPDVYKSPQNQQLLQLQFSIPVLDWGRSKSKTKTAEANEQFTVYAVEQDKQTFRQQIITQVTLFNMLKEQIASNAQADSIAGEKYQIARERYVLGDLSITDLSIAFQENDQAKRDFINALRDFWGAYYQLRYLSLYDFEKNKKITY